MVRCSVINCNSDSEQKIPGLSFHNFPSKQKLRDIWIAATGRNGWETKKSSKICSKHFDTGVLMKKIRNTYLDPDAIPTKFTKCVHTEIQGDPLPSTSSMEIDNTRDLKNLEPIAPFIKCGSTGTQEDPLPSTSAMEIDNLRHLKNLEAIDSTAEFESPGQSQEPILYQSSSLLNLRCSRIEGSGTARKGNISNDQLSPEFTPRTLRRKWKSERRKSEERLKKLRALREKSRRLGKKVATLESVISALKSKSLIREEDCDMLESVDTMNKDFLKKVISPGPSNKKYSPSLRKFALCLHFISPRAYNYVRSSFSSCLPHPSTLRSWYKSVDGSPGFTNESLECIRLLANRSNRKIYCALSMDEMAIRKHVQWDGKKCVGLVNFGEALDGHSVAVAREALVFMVTAVNDSWKMPVGYFLIDGCTGAQKANLVTHCIELLLSCGIEILSLTFDGCPANFSMAKCLKCAIEPTNVNDLKSSFYVREKEIVILPDAAHMLKLVRNTLGEKKELINVSGQIISWDYITKLNSLQENEGLHLANRLRKQHIQYAKQIMKVRLAAQTFSNSVADSIEFCNKILNLPEFSGSDATVDFIKKINYLFDILNSRNLNSYGFKKSINKNNFENIAEFLNEMEIYIIKLKLGEQPIMKTNRKVGFLGLLICIKSLKTICHKILVPQALSFIPMYKMSQDHLECFFSSIRARGGFNNNPSAMQFESAYKRLVVHGEIKHISSGNCIPLEDIKILTFSEIRYEKKNNLFTKSVSLELDHSDQPQESTSIIDAEHDYLADPTRLNIYCTEIITYIAGFVVKKIRRTIQCEDCLVSLISNKFYGIIAKKDKGGLIYPAKSVIKICEVAERIFRLRSQEGILFLNEKNLLPRLVFSCFKDCVKDKRIFHELHNDDLIVGNHRFMLMKAITMNYFEIRIHHKTKQLSAPIDRVRNVYNKLVLFKGQ